MFTRLFFLTFLIGAVHAAFLPPDDPRLREKSKEVSTEILQSKETQDLIDLMLQISRGEQKDISKDVLVGLAAPQIGQLKRIIIVDVGVDTTFKTLGDLKVFINPRIIEQSPETEISREGCYSVDDRVRALVPRSQWIKIEALDRDGHAFCAKYTGLTAYIFQHEIDHLNGICFPDRDATLHLVEEHECQDYRLNHLNWHRTLTKEECAALNKSPK